LKLHALSTEIPKTNATIFPIMELYLKINVV